MTHNRKKIVDICKACIANGSPIGTEAMQYSFYYDIIELLETQSAEYIDEIQKERDELSDELEGALELVRKKIKRINKLKENQPKKGHWIAEENYDDVVYRCSACDEEWVTLEGTPFDNGMWYCPHCGADMREGEHDA